MSSMYSVPRRSLPSQLVPSCPSCPVSPAPHHPSSPRLPGRSPTFLPGSSGYKVGPCPTNQQSGHQTTNLLNCLDEISHLCRAPLSNLSQPLTRDTTTVQSIKVSHSSGVAAHLIILTSIAQMGKHYFRALKRILGAKSTPKPRDTTRGYAATNDATEKS
jgi:hypothetical protein